MSALDHDAILMALSTFAGVEDEFFDEILAPAVEKIIAPYIAASEAKRKQLEWNEADMAADAERLIEKLKDREFRAHHLAVVQLEAWLPRAWRLVIPGKPL